MKLPQDQLLVEIPDLGEIFYLFDIFVDYKIFIYNIHIKNFVVLPDTMQLLDLLKDNFSRGLSRFIQNYIGRLA